MAAFEKSEHTFNCATPVDTIFGLVLPCSAELVVICGVFPAYVSNGLNNGHYEPLMPPAASAEHLPRAIGNRRQFGHIGRRSRALNQCSNPSLTFRMFAFC